MRILLPIIIFLLLITSGSLAMAEQATKPGPGCSGEGKEAERLYNLGLDYRNGMRGMQFDMKKAIKSMKRLYSLAVPKRLSTWG